MEGIVLFGGGRGSRFLPFPGLSLTPKNWTFLSLRNNVPSGFHIASLSVYIPDTNGLPMLQPESRPLSRSSELRPSDGETKGSCE